MLSTTNTHTHSISLSLFSITHALEIPPPPLYIPFFFSIFPKITLSTFSLSRFLPLSLYLSPSLSFSLSLSLSLTLPYHCLSVFPILSLYLTLPWWNSFSSISISFSLSLTHTFSTQSSLFQLASFQFQTHHHTHLHTLSSLHLITMLLPPNPTHLLQKLCTSHRCRRN